MAKRKTKRKQRGGARIKFGSNPLANPRAFFRDLYTGQPYFSPGYKLPVNGYIQTKNPLLR